MNRRDHWDQVYQSKNNNEVSWFQPRSIDSMLLIEASGITRDQAIIDVGGGASVLVDNLLSAGFHNISVLDISDSALAASRNRLGTDAGKVNWIQADLLQANLEFGRFDLWHDRAVYHFLTNEEDQHIYLKLLMQSLKPHGQLIIATFAENGPARCSGLDVIRYSPAELQIKWQGKLQLIESKAVTHITQVGREQKFNYCRFLKI
ncbi:MAG: class I SAM-dependent methyltransferase [bacterium]